MCGFAGCVDARLSPSSRRSVLTAMSARLARRGTDDEALYDDGHLAFAFRGLAIVDLATGQQPIIQPA
jgi:asparagine synthase (glutamine-hydrolysing)